MRWMEKHRVFVELPQHRVRVHKLRGIERYLRAPDLRVCAESSVSLEYNLRQYASFSLLLFPTDFWEVEPYVNTAWLVGMTDLVALLAVEWHRHAYAHFKLWLLSA